MNDSTRRVDQLRVCKRDGSVEPFSIAKMLHCIRAGLAACGEHAEFDLVTARSLGEAVHDYLLNSHHERSISSRHLADLVDTVLSQTGHSAAAMALRDYNSFREQQRRMVMVASPRPRDGRFVQHRWNKALLVQHLRRQHTLDSPTARMIAGRVEQLIFCCGLRAVTGGLVREMVRSELLAWGLLPGALVVKRAFAVRDKKGRVRDNLDSAQ